MNNHHETPQISFRKQLISNSFLTNSKFLNRSNNKKASKSLFLISFVLITV